MIFTVFAKAQSSKVWSKLERELRFEAKPRAGALIWSQTLSGSAFEVQNLEPELMFGAKPRAGAHRALSRAKYAMHGVVEGSGEQKHCIYCVFARLKAQSSKVGL